MSDLAALLLASLKPSSQKQAERSLTALSLQPGFLSHVHQLILASEQDRSVRLAASVYLKNVTKLRWEDDVQPISDDDKVALKGALVPAMIALSNPTDRPIRAQVAESVSLIAELDFPTRWPDLIDQLTSSLSPTNYNINLGVLQTAHSIFRHWRAHARSDALFSEINLVLSTFMTPFLQLFRQTSTLLLTRPSPNPELTSIPGGYALLAQSMVILVDIFYDFTCQDLPPAIEDAYDEFWAAGTGWFLAFLGWQPVELLSDPEDPAPSLPSEIKTRILEIAELYIKLYPDQLQRSPAVENLVSAVWNLVGANRLPGIPDDGLVSQSLRFISTAIRSGYYKSLFSTRETISSLVEGVVVPNVTLRTHDIEQFEDEPLEYIRLDLSLSSTGADLSTRRQAAADVLQALVGSGYEAETTDIVGRWVSSGLAEYQTDKKGLWKSKDSAIYLLTAVATRGSTMQHGVTSVNVLIDVVKFFGDHIFEDLKANVGTVHPILQVDAIKFLYTFRNQLSKDQLLSVLPLLVHHVNSDNFVIYTYAAITIDRILFIKQEGKLLFNQADIRDIAPQLVSTLLTRIETSQTPDRISENDHLMKCLMRVIITARETLTPGFERTLARLVAILGVISKNPTNPRFDQFIFESLSALMRFVVGGTPATLPVFEQALFGPFTIILQQDVEQYIPYVFQVLAQMLELHPTSVPAEYRGLLPFLLTPAMWQQKGSIPGLVKLLKAFLARDSPQMAAQGQIASVLAVLQQRLIPSNINDVWGFELLQSIVKNVSPTMLRQYFKAVIITLLTRMQKSKTDQFVYLFTRFLLFSMAIRVEGLQPDYIISTVEEIQPQLWSQILANFVIPQLSKIPHKDRKLAVVGLTKMLTQSNIMLQEPTIRSWPIAFTGLVKLFREPQYLARSSDTEVNAHAALTEIDVEEQLAGYQAAYSRLAASEVIEEDPVAYIPDAQQFLGNELAGLSQRGGQQVKAMLGAADQNVVGPFLQTLRGAGFAV